VAVREKLTELKALERSIAAFVVSCDTSCAGGPGPDCVIFEDISRAAGDVKVARPRHGSTASR
jgi:MerR family transcriptional regulator, copper efflux regulator